MDAKHLEYLYQCLELFLSNGNRFSLIHVLSYLSSLAKWDMPTNDSSVAIKDHKGDRHTRHWFFTLLSLCLNVTHLNATARDLQRTLIQKVEKGSQITKWHLKQHSSVLHKFCKLALISIKIYFDGENRYGTSFFVIKIGTRINCALFVFLCVLIQKQLSSKSNFRIIIFVERILNMKREVTA